MQDLELQTVSGTKEELSLMAREFTEQAEYLYATPEIVDACNFVYKKMLKAQQIFSSTKHHKTKSHEFNFLFVRFETFYNSPDPSEIASVYSDDIKKFVMEHISNICTQEDEKKKLDIFINGFDEIKELYEFSQKIECVLYIMKLLNAKSIGNVFSLAKDEQGLARMLWWATHKTVEIPNTISPVTMFAVLMKMSHEVAGIDYSASHYIQPAESYCKNRGLDVSDDEFNTLSFFMLKLLDYNLYVSEEQYSQVRSMVAKHDDKVDISHDTQTHLFYSSSNSTTASDDTHDILICEQHEIVALLHYQITLLQSTLLGILDDPNLLNVSLREEAQTGLRLLENQLKKLAELSNKSKTIHPYIARDFINLGASLINISDDVSINVQLSAKKIKKCLC